MKLQGFILSVLLSGLATVESASIPLEQRQTTPSARAEAVKEAFNHSWNGYVKYAFGKDELRPVSNTGSNSRNGWGASVVDALTTAIIMRSQPAVVKQLEFIAKIDFTKSKDTVSLFETTIRYLGGLLSGYDLLTGPYADLVAGNKTRVELVGKLLEQAETLAIRLSFGFKTPTGIPANNLNFGTNSFTDTTNGIATAGTLVLEWTRLSDLTGKRVYADLAQKAQSYLLSPKPASGEPFPGLLGTNLNLRTGMFVDSYGGWGGGTDSFYEYLIKMYIYDPARFGLYRDRWVKAADSTMKYLTSHPSSRPDITFVAEYDDANSISLNEGHLACFIGGNFILGGQALKVQKYIDYGLELTSGCHETYARTASHIGPELFSWDASKIPASDTTTRNFFQKNGYYVTSGYYILRPEVVESYYHAWVYTRDEKYREWAWEAFQSINANCRTSSGYSSITDVMKANGGRKDDLQESFWFAEVLKYFYLIFADDGPVGFEKGSQTWVFNTEAHPFRVVGDCL